MDCFKITNQFQFNFPFGKGKQQNKLRSLPFGQDVATVHCAYLSHSRFELQVKERENLLAPDLIHSFLNFDFQV